MLVHIHSKYSVTVNLSAALRMCYAATSLCVFIYMLTCRIKYQSILAFCIINLMLIARGDSNGLTLFEELNTTS